MLFLPDIPTCTHEDSPFHPFFPETSALASSHFQGVVPFLCQSPGSRPTSFTDVRVSGAVGRLSSDLKARQPSSLSRILLVIASIYFSNYIYFWKTA